MDVMSLNHFFWNVLTDIDFNLPLYIVSTGYWINQPQVVRKEGYKAYQWIQCFDGQGLLEIDGKSIPIAKGQGMLLYPGVAHRYFPVSEPWTVRWIAFNGKFAESLLHSLHLQKSMVLYTTKPELLLTRINEINSIFGIRRNISSYEGSHLLYGLILDIFRYTSLSDNRSNQEQYEHLKPVMDYIETHFDQPISLLDLANQLAVTPPYTCVLFQQTLGTRPFEYINLFRIRKAKELLQLYPELEIKTISTKVGFESPSYFIKLFKKHEGITPNEFKKMHTIHL
ncbi:AraC family transcriptional regulator [Paenibacillus sp. SYP-B3998]|uniref:AraC family transcriptional regulator n=1 Tax=Paenibacillus sp. SYP-B3998 TaxID=2678564 RepID=A0A6G3ZUQ1_9BACL|nr:AraC family transcriptional regulator [Paenibacillus sp. SYP-B3998]NEW05768.1 AraC family transcriptional regulator [Paenibacillus sp. SYP-B3998]